MTHRSVLSLLSGSVVALLDVAQFWMVRGGPPTVTVMVAVAEAPAASVPNEHEMVPPPGGGVQLLLVAVTVTPPGRVSVAVTLLAGSGPLLWAVRV